MKLLWKQAGILLLSVCMILPMLPVLPAKVFAASEQFSLSTGQTYYFDLSGQGVPGTVNPELPDTGLRWVPFTYAGTVNAYSLDASSIDNITASDNAVPSDRSLFVADHATHSEVTWDELDDADLIFGKDYHAGGITYKLRSLSVGSATNGESGVDTRGMPETNEWDQMLNKDEAYIKNHSVIYSWGQDTDSEDFPYRVLRGGTTNRGLSWSLSFEWWGNVNFHPALEVLNADTLGPDGLKDVILELGDGSFDGANSIHIVSAGDQFTAPSGTGLTPPVDRLFDKWQKTGDPGTTYTAGQTVAYEDGLGLTALWAYITTPEATPAIAIDYSDEQLTGFIADGSYTIDGASVSPVSGELDIASYIGTTISIVKEGNGTTTTDSDAQSLVIPARPGTPTASAVDPAAIGSTGAITGVTAAMAYKSSAGDWTDVTGTEINDLAAGIYHIRVKATATGFKSAEQIVTLTDPAPVVYTVMIGNGGSGASGGGDYADGDTVSIQAGTRSGYSFRGWASSDGVSFADAGSAATTFVMPAHHVTVTANWRDIGGSTGDGGGGGGSSPTLPNSPAITIDKKPNQPTIASVTLTAAVDPNGHASVTITEPLIQALIDAAKEEGRNDGNTVDGIGIVCHIQFGAGGISFSVELGKEALALLAKEGVKRFDIHTALAGFSFDETAIQEIDAQAMEDVAFGAKPVTELPDEAKAWIGSRPVYELTVSYQEDDKTADVTDFGKGTVTLSLPYEAASGEKSGDLYAVYVDKDGQPRLLIRSRYEDGKLMFGRNSLSVYGVGYLEPAPAFRDTAKHWAKADIDFVVSRRLVSGTSTATFSPDTAITRADFLMALGKLSGADVSGYRQSGFTDVSGASPAMPYIEWAVQNKIVQGVGHNRFDPNSPITREQMTVMMVGYAAVAGHKLPVSQQAVTFADDAKISAWAKEAVAAIRQTGIVVGKTNNRFDPAGNATRAEASTILRRFVAFVIDESH